MIRTLSIAVALLLSQAAFADALDTIKARGKLIVGSNAEAPPFGFVNPDKTISGYDIDMATLVAKKLGVQLVVQNVSPSERIDFLRSGKIDLIAATMTKTAERERQVDFSYGYFITGQKVLSKKGRFPDAGTLGGATIGVARGSTSETQFKQLFPKAMLISMDTTMQAVDFFKAGKIDGVTGDEPALAGLLTKLPNASQYELSVFSLSTEAYGMAVKKGESRLLRQVNDALTDAEKSGEAAKIFNRWFGPNSANPLVRFFKIGGA